MEAGALPVSGVVSTKYVGRLPAEVRESSRMMRSLIVVALAVFLCAGSRWYFRFVSGRILDSVGRLHDVHVGVACQDKNASIHLAFRALLLFAWTSNRGSCSVEFGSNRFELCVAGRAIADGRKKCRVVE